MREAPRIRLIADRSQIHSAIARIVESWPVVRSPGEKAAAA
jgi:hypothetical protein